MVKPTRAEKITLLKYGIVTYLSFFIAGLLNLPVTTTIAFTAILVLSFGATWKGITRYSINRTFAQVIGVIVGFILFYSIFAIPHLPTYQKYAISMTIGTLTSIYIRIIFKLDVTDFAMFTPAMLVLLMSPSSPWYPLLRMIYTIIGCVIGIVINYAIFPPKKQSELSIQEWINLTNENMRWLLVDPGIWTPNEERLERMQTVETGLAKIQSSLAGKPESEIEVARHRLNSTSTRIMREISQCVKDRNVSEDAMHESHKFLETMFHVHTQLLSNPESIAECKMPELKMPELKNPADIVLWSRVIEGYDNLQKFLDNHNTAVKRMSSRLIAAKQKDKNTLEEGDA